MPSALDPGDTIAAQASPRGPAARSIVRLSGPKAFPIALAGFSTSEGPGSPRRVELPGSHAGYLKAHGIAAPLAGHDGAVAWPAIVHRQDVAEIHFTGSAAL